MLVSSKAVQNKVKDRWKTKPSMWKRHGTGRGGDFSIQLKGTDQASVISLYVLHLQNYRLLLLTYALRNVCNSISWDQKGFFLHI